MKGLIFAVALTSIAFVAYYNMNKTNFPEEVDFYYEMTENGDFIPYDPNGQFYFDYRDPHPNVTVYGDGYVQAGRYVNETLKFPAVTTYIAPEVLKNQKATIHVAVTRFGRGNTDNQIYAGVVLKSHNNNTIIGKD